MNDLIRSQAGRRLYDRVLFVVMPLLGLVLFGDFWVYPHLHPKGVLASLLAALPALPILAVMVIFRLYLAGAKDEFEQTIQVQSLLWALWSDPCGSRNYGVPVRFRPNFTLKRVLGRPAVPVRPRPARTRTRPEPPIKNRLRKLRIARNWSQAEVAERLEVSRQSINAMEEGTYEPSLPLAFKVARLFETTIEDIFIDQNPK
jgi:putative transcriptional regulator